MGSSSRARGATTSMVRQMVEQGAGVSAGEQFGGRVGRTGRSQRRRGRNPRTAIRHLFALGGHRLIGHIAGPHQVSVSAARLAAFAEAIASLDARSADSTRCWTRVRTTWLTPDGVAMARLLQRRTRHGGLCRQRPARGRLLPSAIRQRDLAVQRMFRSSASTTCR